MKKFLLVLSLSALLFGCASDDEGSGYSLDLTCRSQDPIMTLKSDSGDTFSYATCRIIDISSSSEPSYCTFTGGSGANTYRLACTGTLPTSGLFLTYIYEARCALYDGTVVKSAACHL